MRLLQSFALGAVLSGYATVVLGGYVSSIGAGLACPDWPTCQGQIVPSLSDPLVAAEYFHRLAAAIVGVLALGSLLLVWGLYRAQTKLVIATTAAFGLLVTQVLLGMIAITSRLPPVVVTAHLAVATAFIATMTVAAVLTFLPGKEAGSAQIASSAQEAS